MIENYFELDLDNNINIIKTSEDELKQLWKESGCFYFYKLDDLL